MQVKTVPIEACLPADLYRSIRLSGSSSAWEVGFYYGKGQPEVVATVRNSQCWTKSSKGTRQHGVVGVYVVAFICCRLYCGWVGGRIPPSGKVQLKRMVLPREHDPLRRYRTRETDRTGQYNDRVLLK